MKYYPKQKGLFGHIALYSDTGKKLKMPRDISARYKIVGNQIYFELIFDNKPITPAVKSVETDGHVWTINLYDGGYYYLDIETLVHTAVISKNIEDISITRAGNLIIGNTVQKNLFLDNDMLGKDVKNRYLFSSIIGVRNESGKCSILDCETCTYLTGFEFDPKKYDIVDALNNETELADYDRIYIIEREKDNVKNFLHVDEDGKFVARINADKYLWKFARKEKVGGSTKHFVYAAFAAKTNEGKEYTKILKIDSRSKEVVFEKNIKGTAKKEIQFKEDFIELDDGAILLKTSEMNEKTNTEMFGVSILYPNGTAKIVRANEHEDIVRARDPKNGMYIFRDEPVFITKKQDENGNSKYGAVKLTKEHIVEVLLDSTCSKIEIKKDSDKNYFLEFVGGKKFGKIPLSSSGNGYVSSVSSFVSLAHKHFGLGRESENEATKPKRKKETDIPASIFDLLGTPKNKQNGEE